MPGSATAGPPAPVYDALRIGGQNGGMYGFPLAFAQRLDVTPHTLMSLESEPTATRPPIPDAMCDGGKDDSAAAESTGIGAVLVVLVAGTALTS